MSLAKTILKRWLPPAAVDAYRAVKARVSVPERAAPPLAAVEFQAAPALAGEAAPAVEFRLPTVPLRDLFRGVEGLTAEVPISQIVRQRDMVLPLAELLTIAGICRAMRPRRIFEMGTYSGASTLVMALNAPADVEIVTLDFDTSDPIIGSCFRDSPLVSRIRQVRGDTRTFDFGPYRQVEDLVFIDANHAYEFVRDDTARAFEILRPGGVIVWDDYRWLPEHRECVGVTNFLNDLIVTRKCFSIQGTRLAVYVDRNDEGSPRT